MRFTDYGPDADSGSLTVGWQLPEMFAGVPGRGAEEGWYATAIDIEYLRIMG